MDLLLQTAGSLVAILALAGLAWWMKLGGAPRLDGEQAVMRAAGEVEDGFRPVATACDAEGVAALACDAAGRIMVIRRHGNRFAGRVLGPRAAARLGDHPGEFNLVIDSGEPRFGRVFLTLTDAQAWAEAINRLNATQDA
jgi:hypothetical protein